MEYKKIRNKVNNKKKLEEKNFKSHKLAQNSNSPAKTWQTVKDFMDWEESGGPPSQLSIGNKLISKASLIASEMNKYFIEKVQTIRAGIQYYPNSFNKCKEIMESNNCSFGLRHVQLSKVNKLLKI